MKKLGVVIFGVALVAGLVLSNFFSFGKAKDGLFSFSFFGGTHGSGNVVTEKRNVSGFKAIDVGGVFKVDVIAQKDFAVEVEADDNLLPLIKTEVSDGVLRIEADKRLSSKNIRIRVSAPDLEKIEASGVSSVSLAAVKNSSLAVDCSGASKISVEGETAKLNVDASGASHVDAQNLKATDVVASAGGASHVNVNVFGNLNADSTGASTINYSGTPTSVHKSASGASGIHAN